MSYFQIVSIFFFCFLQVSGHLAATAYITIMTQDIVTLLQPVNRELGNDVPWVFLRCKITLQSIPEKNPSWNRVEKIVATLGKINTDCKRRTENSRLNHPRCVIGKTASLKRDDISESSRSHSLYLRWNRNTRQRS